MPLGAAYNMLNQAVGSYQGKFAQVGQAIKAMITERQEMAKEKRQFGQKKELLGEEARLKYSPEALKFEKAKQRISGSGVKVVGKTLVDTQGNVLYEAPADTDLKVVNGRLVEFNKRTRKARNITDWEGNVLPEFQQGGDTGGIMKTDFASEQEALRANLPKGTKITINGRPAIIE